MKTNIVVCIKQVPDTTGIKIDPVKNTLIRTDVSSIMNLFNKNALETGLRLKDHYGGKVAVISIGPPWAKAVLREALAMGAGEAYLVTNRAFGGPGTYATSYILPQMIKKLGGFDIILGGKQAIGGDMGQTAPNIAEHLGVVRLTYILSMGIKGGKVIAKHQVKEGMEVTEANLPVLCAVTKKSNKPRYTTIKGVLNSLRAKIGKIALANLPDSDTTKMDLEDSPTKVKVTFTPKRNANCMNIEGNSPAETTETPIDRLTETRVL